MPVNPRQLTQNDHSAPHPVYVVWELTLRCDQACRHCGSRAGKGRTRELGTDQALELVRQIQELGAREVTLIGGEAYLRSDWLQIVAAITGRGMACSLVTGGRGLSAERARAAAEAGLSTLCVSVDGLGPTHDRLRAVPASFDAAMAAIEVARQAGLAVTVNTQINRENWTELAALGTLLAERGVRGWQLQLTTPMGRAADSDRLILQPWMLLDVLPRLADVATTVRARGCSVNIANNLGYFGPHEGQLRAGGHWIGCTGGRWSLGVQSDGTVKACGSLPTDPYGDASAADLPLAEIIATSAGVRAVTERTVDDLWGFCADCYYAELCKGGCPWTAHTLLGRPGNQPYCHHRALELRARGRRERLVRVEEPGGGGFDYGRWELIEEDWPA